MLDNIIKDADFASIMEKNIQNMIIHFFEKDQNFGVLCNIEDVTFEPILPDEIATSFHPMTLFFLAGYTYETARIIDGCLVFEAGFGGDNVGSLVNVPLLSIMQIIVDETPVLINLATYRNEVTQASNDTNANGVQNSMNSFLSNPENSKFIK